MSNHDKKIILLEQRVLQRNVNPTPPSDGPKILSINGERNNGGMPMEIDEGSKSNAPVVHELLDDSFSSSKHKYESSDGKKETTPKKQKLDNIEHTPENGGSQGAIIKPKMTITSFFPRESGPSTFPDPEKLSKRLSKNVINLDANVNVIPSSLSIISNNTPITPQSSVTNTAMTTTTTTIATASASTSNNNASNVNNNEAKSTSTLINELKKQIETLKNTNLQNDGKYNRMESENKMLNEKLKLNEDKNIKIVKALEEVYRNMATQQARRRRDRLAADCVRLGKITTIRVSPTSLQDVWEEGYALKELNGRMATLLERKEELEKRKKKLQSLKRSANKKMNASTSGGGNTVNNNGNGNNEKDTEEDSFDMNPVGINNNLDLDILVEECAIKTHLEQIRKDENGLIEEKKLLDGEKAVHQKEIKRSLNEDNSRFFPDLPLLHSRYLLLTMLGRGGFSEVWKAMDLIELKEVAVKLHQLNTTWSDSRKQSYVKHVTREYTIHRDMMHPRVVQLFDVFEIDVNSFATVLEYCKGIDLDEKLKTMKIIPEKDARTILLQILSGLRYLNSPTTMSSSSASSGYITNVNDAISDQANNGQDVENNNMNMVLPINQMRKRSIIHFDLKPANILFDEMGDVKITDFGLSKILDEGENANMTSMELTSQGAGTYWYLPPECFGGNEDEPPRISNKVDVWSLGVIFYQMLYGKRPFGEGKSQEKVLSERIMLSPTQIDFNSNDVKAIKVSDEAKDFLSACLTWDQKLRPDVLMLCQHSYIRSSPKK